VKLEEAKAALAELPKAERDAILELPAHEAYFIVRLLVTFPGARLVEGEK
jgi:hypothetical protein